MVSMIAFFDSKMSESPSVLQEVLSGPRPRLTGKQNRIFRRTVDSRARYACLCISTLGVDASVDSPRVEVHPGPGH